MSKEEVVNSNITKLKLVRIPDTDKDGKEILENGELTYDRHDNGVLHRFINALDGNTMSTDKQRVWAVLIDKVKEAWKFDIDELELSVGEVAFLNEWLEKPKFRDVVTSTGQSVPAFSMIPFYTKSICSFREQLK